MPLYEYLCEDCTHSFETLVPFSKADQPQRCPQCGNVHSQRKLSTFAVGGSSQAPVSTRPANSRFT
jgi:putative FmdB family regulatory protein